MADPQFAAQDAELAEIKVHGFAGLNPNEAKYLLISKGPNSLTFHPLLIVRSDTHGPVCRLDANTKFCIPVMLSTVQSVESQISALLDTYVLPAYSVDTTHVLSDVAYGRKTIDLNGYPQAELVGKLFYSMRHLRQKQN